MRASGVTVLLLVGFFLCVGVRADILVESPFDLETRPLVCAYTDLVGVSTDVLIEPPVDVEVRPLVRAYSDLEAHRSNPVSLHGYTSIPDLMPEHIPFLTDAEMDGAQPSHGQSVLVLMDGQSSLSLCLSALMSLGLYTSIHTVKKQSLGFIPQWYHSGGPFQIGHSFPVNPDSVCPVPVCCFVQPVRGVADVAFQFHFGTVISLWRTSQFTPDLLAARGPPVTC